MKYQGGGIVITFFRIDVITGNHCYKARVEGHSALVEIKINSNCPKFDTAPIWQENYLPGLAYLKWRGENWNGQ